ncbi:hypothetical protein [Saccharopolyspora hattusasensis]|uniref:hypothetical protein n=1 Tax=Saccharopolyspora hattusasensis TaxID=1128679 RepID=UPI003D99D954
MSDLNLLVLVAVLVPLVLAAVVCAVASIAPRRHGSIADHLSDWWVIARGLASGRWARLRNSAHRGGARRG